jgi:DnaJ family protein C protein 27
MQRDDKNLYSLVGALRNATLDEIKKSYKKTALLNHPDKGGDAEVFRAIVKAFEVLSDQKRRRDYDQQLERTGSTDGVNAPASGDVRRSTTKKPSAAAAPTKTTSVVRIPPNPEALSVKELKSLLVSLNIRHDDCLEKRDLLQRIQEARSGSVPVGPSVKFDHISIKVLSIGDPEVGKSCLIKRYCEGRFVQRYISTIGVDYGVKKLPVLGQKLSVNFFDLSGTQEYESIRTEFYRETQGVLMAFEVNVRATFANLARWEREAKSSGLDLSQVQVVVCGNKIDVAGREVPMSEASKWASSKGFGYFETSASSGQGVNEAFDSLFSKVLNQVVSQSAQWR